MKSDENNRWHLDLQQILGCKRFFGQIRVQTEIDHFSTASVFTKVHHGIATCCDIKALHRPNRLNTIPNLCISSPAMASPIPKSAVSAILILLFMSACLGSSDVPFIVAHKKASLNRLKSGAERVSVSIDIYNQGST